MNLAVSSIAVVITGSAGAETRSSLSVPCPFLVPQIFSIYFKFKASFFDKRSSIPLLIYIYSKTCPKLPLKKMTKIGFKTDYRLMQVKSIAECIGSILQYFQLLLSYRLPLRSLFWLFLSDRLRQVLPYTSYLFSHMTGLFPFQNLPKNLDQSIFRYRFLGNFSEAPVL